MRTVTITNKNHVSDDVIEQIKELSPEILAMHDVIIAAPKLISGRAAYICPVCENGTGRDGTGIVPQNKGNAWLYHCFKCDKTFDNIHLLAIHYSLDETNDFSEICHRACEEFGIWFERDNAPSFQKPITEPDDQSELKIVNDDIARARQNLARLPISARRGLTLDTLEHFNCGFISDWVHPICKIKGIRGVPTPRLIIPSGNHYLARLIVDESQYDESKRKYIIPKQHAGKKFFFNFDSLSNDSNILNTIVEGEIDAMSIWQATCGIIPVVAVAGVTGQKKLISQIDKKFNKSKDKPRFMILFDPDKTGRTAAEKLKNELNNAGFTTTVRFFSDEMSKTDANDILRENGNKKLAEIIYSMINDSKKEIKEKNVQFDKEQRIVEKIKKWTKIHGEIAPEILADLKESADYLQSLTVEKITYSLAIQSKTCCALAKCQYYDFYSEASDKFFECMKEAKKRATRILKNLKPNDPIPQGISGLDFITKKDITDKIKAHLSMVVKNHKNYIEKLRKEQEKQQKIERINEQNKQKQNNISRIQELYTQPENPERNEEIVKLIQKSCTWRKNKEGEKVCVQPTITNYDLIFTYDPVLSDLFALDKFQHAIVLLKRPPWNEDARPRETWWSDDDDANMRTYIRRHYGAIANDSLYHDTFTAYAWERAFHSVREYLNNLPEWDGTPRAETLFVKFLKADDTEYTRAVTMNWLLGAASRAFHPGCEFQTALVLQGAQGTGKSFLAKKLGGKWHDALKDSVEDPHALDVIRGSWIVELEEFWPADKANVNALKAFISSSVDTRREVYARRALKYFRQCVFIITSNDKQLLKDKTGNRRFIIISCNSKTFDYVKGLDENYIQQVWAEVMKKYNEMFKDGFDEKKLELPFNIRNQAEEIATASVENDNLESEVKAFLDVKVPPPILFNLLTPYERNKFFISNSIVLATAEWKKRAESLPQRDGEAFYKALNNTRFTRKTTKYIDGSPTESIIVYGSVLREETCVAEIANECLGTRNRKEFHRINDILCSLTDWIPAEKRERNFHNCYGDQKRIYRRSLILNKETE